MHDNSSAPVRHVAFLGNYLPRRCGIATFTTDLTEAISETHSGIECEVVAMNDRGARHAYGPAVRFEIAENDLAAYRRAADFLNVGRAEVLSVQHEYGIFGGKAGSHLLTLLRDLRIPIVTTLHTLLRNPSAEQRLVLEELIQLSTRLVVMSQYGADLLHDVHGVSASKIDVIHHGIPTLSSTGSGKALLAVEGKAVILTFGLLSPDKGIEYAIEALPSVVPRHPDVVYVVLGTTHPHVKEKSGDAYRSRLELLAHRLGVDSNVIFHDRFVTLPELVEFLSAADIYVTPYVNTEQVSSGTLAYAVGAGKAVISTPYPYAKELLAEGRGLLVPPRDSRALAETINALLDNPKELAAVSERAVLYGRNMEWPSVARRYVESFTQARGGHARIGNRRFKAKTLADRPMQLPDLNLKHLRQMTDDTGLLQHAVFSTPRYEDGYCVDDNARGLLLTTLLEDPGTDEPEATQFLASRYLAFVACAFDRSTLRFRNFMSYSRSWTEAAGSEDSQGRSLWALGAVVGRSREPGEQSLAGELFQAALPAIQTLKSPRAWAFALLGLNEYLRAFQGDSAVEAVCRELSSQLLASFEQHRGPEWCWCEDSLSYDNARLPQALLVSGSRRGDTAMTATGLEALAWLTRVQTSPDGYFSPIGSNGFYQRGSEPARFDQQPIEACASVSACRDAWLITGELRWATEMRRAFHWFLGQNLLGAALYDPASGGCCDGIHPDRVNLNRGAESTLSFLLALAELRAFETAIRLQGAMQRKGQSSHPESTTGAPE